MRLSTENRSQIIDIVKMELGEQPVVSLFGSRLNDAAKGGDVDLLIETADTVPLLTKARIKMRLESMLNLPVDIVVIVAGQALTAFQKMARSKSMPL